jgi:hypothetical protein
VEIFILWLALGIVAGVVAANKGRSGFGFFLLSIVLSPLIGIIAALAAKSREGIEQDKVQAWGISKDFRKGPSCAEVVRREAVKCRFCGTDLPPVDQSDSPAHRAGKALAQKLRRR